ncbi:hypothetical protein ACKWTF_005928 [Chironomus riparius]
MDKLKSILFLLFCLLYLKENLVIGTIRNDRKLYFFNFTTVKPLAQRIKDKMSSRIPQNYGIYNFTQDYNYNNWNVLFTYLYTKPKFWTSKFIIFYANKASST